MTDNIDPLNPHVHDPNPDPPGDDTTFVLTVGGLSEPIALAGLQRLPFMTIEACYIVSTGHGTSGPFAFGGTPLLTLLEHYAKDAVPVEATVTVVSDDGFGTRLSLTELHRVSARPPLLAYMIDGRPLSRQEGLVRLIVPSEQDDALRQVKWVSRIAVL